MKYLFLIVSLLMLSCASSKSISYTRNVPTGIAFSVAGNDLNMLEMDQIMKALDSRCGINWCLGGWVYHFERGGRISCDWRIDKCYLSAKVYLDTGRTTFRSCEISGLSKFRDIINRDLLTPYFHHGVIQCIEEWEEQGIGGIRR